jgi:YD repeat-containing protein
MPWFCSSHLPKNTFRVFHVFRGRRVCLLDFVVMVCLAVATPLRAEETKAWSPQSPAWAQIEVALGSVGLDGTLRLSYPLVDSDELKALGLRCALVHAIEQDASGRARTVWRFTGLQSYLVPEGRDKLRWQLPGSAIVRFERAKIGRALAEAGSPRWLIRESAPGDYEIRALDGRAWRYAQGLLVAAEHPALGKIRFDTQGGLIREIRRADVTGGAALLLRAEYDNDAHVVMLTVGPTSRHAFIWDDAGQLVVWRRNDGTETKFAYRDGLLAEVAILGQPALRFAWAENPGWRRGDSKWPASVHLAADGRNDYSYNLTSSGLVSRVRERASGEETVTVFNPLRSRLEQRSGNETRVVWFRKNSAGRGALQHIEKGTGEVLEDYRYDQHGQLVAIKRQSEPERALSYDESGRLMSLQEINP